MNKALSAALAALIALSMATACAPAQTPTMQPPTAQAEPLVVRIQYPQAANSTVMGQGIKGIVKVLDQQGNAVREAQVDVSILDPSGQLVASLPATVGAGDLYRTELWAIPHKREQGAWTVRAEAEAGDRRGTTSTTFQVKDSTSEQLLSKYGFWIEAPTLRGIVPFVGKEEGDAQNGVIIWGGQQMMQHVFAENWLEVHWRQGDFKLSTPDQVRSFLVNTLGDLGFTPVRDLGPFERVKFKEWDAWQGKARGQLTRYDEQWMVFYAPEADKTYALGTTAVLAPKGVEPHALLRNSFEVHPEIEADGKAPQPLPSLLPAPELTGPELGVRVFGTDQPILLSWKPLKELAPDEYYQVGVDYNYGEANVLVNYSTRETQMALPELLYDTPNCGVFNWQVRLMQQTGVGADGQPKGKALSHGSLYWYVEWFHPLDAPAPFDPLCPNEQK